MPISTPPTTPNTADPATFDARVSAWVAWWLAAIPDINTLAGMTNSGTFLAGTAAAPGIKFTSDADTGLFWPSSNQIGFSTGGAQRALLSSAALQLDVPLTGTAVMSSTTDATAGRMMAVGAFGVGGAVLLSGATLLKDRGLKPGFYQYSANDIADAPESAAWAHSLLVGQLPSDGRRSFISARMTSSWPKVWFGAQSSDTGTIAWKEIYTQASVLATVSQSGGAPTGGLLEYGSGANGKYLRFADGTQICWFDTFINTALAADTTTEATWTFPAEFVSGSTPNFGCNLRSINDATSRAGAAKFFGCAMTPINYQSAYVTGHNRDTSTRQFRVDVSAIGRWF